MWASLEQQFDDQQLDRIRPLGRIGAKAAGMRHDADTTQIKPVGIPTSLNGHVGMGTFVRVAVARLEQQPELMVFEIENAAPQIQSEFSRSWAVLRISHFVLPPRVMENSKELHDLNIGPGLFGQSKAVFKDSGPVCHAMIAVKRQSVIFQNRMNDRS